MYIHIILYQGGKTVERIEGAKAAELTNSVAKHAKGVSSNKSSSLNENDVKPAKDLNTRLKSLIESASVMVFIKGTPQQVKGYIGLGLVINHKKKQRGCQKE